MNLRGPALVLAAMLFGAAALVVAKFAIAETDGLVFSFLITLFATLFCGLWAWADGDTAPPHATGKARWVFAGHVLASFVGAWSLWTSLAYIDPAAASILSRVEIVFSLALAGIFLGERFRPVERIGAVVAVGGVAAMKLASTGTLALVWDSAGGKGFVLAILTAAGYATAEVFAKAGTHSASAPAFAFYRNLCLSFLFAGILAVRGEVSVPGPRVWAVAAAAAVAGPVVARVLWLKGLRLMPLSRAVVLAQTHPLWTALLTWGILGTTLTRGEWGGALVLLTGCLIVATGGSVGRRVPAPVAPVPAPE